MSSNHSILEKSTQTIVGRSDSPLRITHVVLSLDVGGLERIVVDLAQVNRAHGHAPSVLCLERPGTLSAQLENLGIPVYCADRQPGLRLSTIDKVRSLLKHLRPDVIHTHQIGALLFTGPAARIEKVPVIVHTEHSNHIANQRSRQMRLRTRLLFRLAGSFAKRFFCVSNNIASEVKAYRVISSKKTIVVPNGIDTSKFDAPEESIFLRQELGIPDDVPVIGTVGRLIEVKRQDVLIRGFSRLGNHNPLPHLLLVGDGPESGALRKLADSLGIGNRVHFAGYQSRPEKYLHVMDVFALTSRLEGMPLAILEAWAAGLPVIASRVGGIPQMITHGVNGLMFGSGNEAELSDLIGRLLTCHHEAQRLAEAGRERVRSQFDLSVMADTYEQHYRDVLGR